MEINNVYDMVLFENFHSAYRHKFDVYLIARLLKSKGLNVAIVNIYNEDKQEDYPNIPLIQLPGLRKIPNDNLWLMNSSLIKRVFGAILFLIQQHFYYKRIVGYIEPLAESFYCGSYHLMMPACFFSSKKKCYYWGLRSHRMAELGKAFKDSPILAVRLWYLKKRFLSNNTQNLFVSNEIIKYEFLKLGVPEKRLIIRDERCIESPISSIQENRDITTSFLVIGGLRRQKNILFTVEAFIKASIPNSLLYLIGENKDEEYENEISKAISDSQNIVRVNKRLGYPDFNNYFSKAHFTLFADEQGKSTITNGTMMESLMCFTPIIAPDYNPYSFYVDKHKIGILYHHGDIDSYASALVEAHKVGRLHYENKIKDFLESITFDKVADRLFVQLSKQ